MDRFQQVVMMDGSISLLHQAMDMTQGRAIYVAGDALHPPFRRAAFDTVLLIRVFHHIQDSRACLSEMSRILCKDGCFIFNYLNKQNASRVVRWLVGRNKENPFDTQTVGCGSTFISHHPDTVNSMLCEAGFADVRPFGAGVLDRFAGSDGVSKHWIGLGEHFAPFLGRSRIAPWILCRAEETRSTNLVDTVNVHDLFQCPACNGSLCEKMDGYQCVNCERWYPVNDGIFDFRIQ
jgi:SAM-dependent methyltransferase